MPTLSGALIKVQGGEGAKTEYQDEYGRGIYHEGEKHFSAACIMVGRMKINKHPDADNKQNLYGKCAN